MAIGPAQRRVREKTRTRQRPVRSFWPVRKNSGQFGQTRPVGGMAGMENEKERALCQHSRVQPVTALA